MNMHAHVANAIPLSSARSKTRAVLLGGACFTLALLAGCAGRIESSLGDPGSSSGASGANGSSGASGANGSSGASSGSNGSSGTSGTSSSSGNVQCRGIPVCNSEEYQVGSYWYAGLNPAANCPQGGKCTVRELCGASVLCADASKCSARAECDRGDKETGRCAAEGCTFGELPCQSGFTCYTRQACGQTVSCAKASCSARPACNQGDIELWSGKKCTQQPCPPIAPPPPCPSGSTCYSRSACDIDILCATPPDPNCDAVPSCNGNDKEVPFPFCTTSSMMGYYVQSVCGTEICCEKKR
jgi:hypothetical protein